MCEHHGFLPQQWEDGATRRTRWPPRSAPWALLVNQWRLADSLRIRILEAVNAEMVARYGSELGVRLDGEFYKAFVEADESMPAPLPSEVLI